MNPLDAMPRPGAVTGDGSDDEEALFDPEDDSDLGIDDATTEDVGLDARAGLEGLSAEEFLEDAGDAESVRWTDDNEAAGDAIGDDGVAGDGEQAEYGWTDGNEPPTDFDEDVDGLPELPQVEGEDRGEEGIEDEDALLDADFGNLPPLRGGDFAGEDDPEGDVMSEFAALAGAEAMRDEDAVAIADGQQWSRYGFAGLQVQGPVDTGLAIVRCGVAGTSLWALADGLHVLLDGQSRAIGREGLPPDPTAIALPAGARLDADGAGRAIVATAAELHGPDGAGGFGPLPPLPPRVDHDGLPLIAAVAAPNERRLAAWPGHGLYVGEPGSGWRPKPACAGVLQLASDGDRHVALVGDGGLQTSGDGGESFGEPVELSAAISDLGGIDGLWVCRGFSVLRGPRGLLAHGPHGFTRLLSLRPAAVALVWETSLPVAYCFVPRHDGGGVVARVELRRTRTPPRVVLEAPAADDPLALGAERDGDATRVQLLLGRALWTLRIATGADATP